MELEFSHALGDLDVYVWDQETDQAVIGPDGARLGSDSADDNETLEYDGPAMIRINGFNNASAPYVMTIDAR